MHLRGWHPGFEHFDIVQLVSESYGIASQKKAGLAKLICVLDPCVLNLVCSLIKVGRDVLEPWFIQPQKHVAKLFVCKADFFEVLLNLVL